MKKTLITLVAIIGFGLNIYSQNISAKIEQVWLEYNVYSGNERGMKIHVKFSVNNMLNKSGNVVAYFYFKMELL